MESDSRWENLMTVSFLSEGCARYLVGNADICRFMPVAGRVALVTFLVTTDM
jgi:hypothetical protein